MAGDMKECDNTPPVDMKLLARPTCWEHKVMLRPVGRTRHPHRHTKSAHMGGSNADNSASVRNATLTY